MNRPLANVALAALVFTGCLALAAPSSAESGPEVAAVDQARTHFQRGADLYKEGNFEAALAEFTRAYDIVPNYRVLYNIAQTQIERHDYVAAQRAFVGYLRLGDTDISQERREQVEAELANIKTRISELTVISNVAGAELSIDGVAVGTLPLARPVPVSAGARRLRLSKRGYTTAERTVSVTGGDKPELAMALEPMSVSAEDRQPSNPPAQVGTSRPLGAGTWVSLAATGVFASGAVAFGLLAQNQNEKLDRELSRYPADRAGTDDVRSRVKLYAGLTDGCVAAAGVSAALTIYFVLAGSGRSERQKVAAAAHVVPLSNGLALAGRF